MTAIYLIFVGTQSSAATMFISFELNDIQYVGKQELL